MQQEQTETIKLQSCQKMESSYYEPNFVWEMVYKVNIAPSTANAQHFFF